MYNHFSEVKIYYKSSKTSNKHFIFTPTETSPLSYSIQTGKKVEKPYFKNSINYFPKNKKENKKIQFNIPENNFTNSKKLNSRVSLPEIKTKKLTGEYNFEEKKEKLKTQKSISQSKISKSLRLFNQQYEILVKTITSKKKEKKNNQRNKALTPYPSEINHFPSPFELEINSLEEEIKLMTNSIEIANFYEYTKNCMKIITEILDKKNEIKKPKKVKIKNPKNLKKLIVFDLDETLIHGIINKSNYKDKENIIKVILPSKKTANIKINIRPNWEEAIIKISKLYCIVIYTASHFSYANSVLNYLDPENKYFYNRLYRSDCIDIKYNGKDIYIKDLEIFQDFDLKNILIVDNSVLAFAFHLDNGIPILPYYDSQKDFELLFCAFYFESIFQYDDLREINKKYMKLDYYLNKALKEKEDENIRDDLTLKSKFDIIKDININNHKGKSANNIQFVNEDDVRKFFEQNSQFCKELEVDLYNLRRQFSQEKK